MLLFQLRTVCSPLIFVAVTSAPMNAHTLCLQVYTSHTVSLFLQNTYPAWWGLISLLKQPAAWTLYQVKVFSYFDPSEHR